MEYCQYGFTYYNEYMKYIDESFINLLSLENYKDEFFSVGKDDFILRKKDENTYVLHSDYDDNYVYYVIVRCEKKYEEEIRKILFKVCDEIYDNYGEDHTKEVYDVIAANEKTYIFDEEKQVLMEQYHINLA